MKNQFLLYAAIGLLMSACQNEDAPMPLNKGIALTGMSISDTSMVLSVDASHTLTLTMLPANAADTKAWWTSSAPEIVSVDSTGFITAHKPGDAVITVIAGCLYSSDSCQKAQCVVAAVLPFEPKMVLVKGDTFLMGSVRGCTECGSDESPQHAVILSDFKIGKYEITQAQWQAVMENNPSGNADCAQCPVENVRMDSSETGIKRFLVRLNTLSGKQYRLPTEAEWEYAARGGSTGGNNDAAIGDVAYYQDNSGNKTNDVGGKTPNGLGLHDMLGNVWEWCSDYYAAYSNGMETDPKGPKEGSFHVRRGGAYNSSAGQCRSAKRQDAAASGGSDIGFRVVISVK